MLLDVDSFYLIDRRGNLLQLNRHLFSFNNVTDTTEKRSKILRLHQQRLDLFDAIGDLPDQDAKLHQLVADLERIEFALQETWGFPQDRDKHSWWWQVPKCKCSYRKNEAAFMLNKPREVDYDCFLHHERFRKQYNAMGFEVKE